MPDASNALPPMRLGEIVLGTCRYDAMKAWYRQVLDMVEATEHVPQRTATAHAGPVRICFFRLHAEHPYQDVVAIFGMAGAAGEDAKGCPGLHHMQLRNASIAVLRERYGRLKQSHIVPEWAMNHGPSTSLYYRDPDRNVVELAASNHGSQQETDACLASDEFLRNPAGKPIDPEGWFKASGET
jgi:catechol-2,3-dioxygenase